MMRVRLLAGLVAGLALSALAVLPARAEAPKALEGLSFLIGTWEAGANAGVPGQGTGSFTFARSLQDRVIVRTNHADYPAAQGRPASSHDDLMVIHAGDGGEVSADYYDNEGHVIRYAVTAGAGRATFLGEASPGAPRFKLEYVLRPDGTPAGEFLVAPPGQPEGFKPYLSWESRRAVAGR